MNNLWLQDQQRFVTTYGALYEHSDWIARQAWQELEEGFNANPEKPREIDAEKLLVSMAAVVNAAGEAPQMNLICAHPDLAGRAAVSGELTDHSTEEQSSARLDQCSAEEFQTFHELNSEYKEKFGFPFIMAVRNRTRQEILHAFANRIKNSVDEEFKLALDNIHQIAHLRLQASLQGQFIKKTGPG